MIPKKLLAIVTFLFAVILGIVVTVNLSDSKPVLDSAVGLSGLEKSLKSANERYEAISVLTNRSDGRTNYAGGNSLKELKKLKSISSARNTSGSEVTANIVERGPSNVPGRARGLVVLPQDETHQTWLVGSSGGGIWKTFDAGSSWVDVSSEFPSLAITSIAYCESEPDVMYAGSGEYVASAFTAVNGDGMFKSVDGGDTWFQLEATAANDVWQSVTRVVVDPNDPDIVLATTAPNYWGEFRSNILKSTDGGASWYSVEEVSTGAFEQLVADPLDFSRLYACRNGVGVYASNDSGETWDLISSGMIPDSRIEIAVSPVNTNYIYASVVGDVDASQEGDMYYSTDRGENWTLITDVVATGNIDALSGQGWYDNTILADPFDLNVFYVGGVGLYKYEVDFDAGVTESDPTFLGAETGGTEAFMGRFNFSADLDGGSIASGSATELSSVEIRFGPDRKQMAHRFLVPSGRGAQVSDSEYTYEDYVEVPFEVWDVGQETERQLMVSFRDQGRDGDFNLIYANTEGGTSDVTNSHSREYLFINSRTYSDEPSPDIATTGGHVDEDFFFIWPFLVDGAEWDPENLPESTFRINWGTLSSGKYVAAGIADPYGNYGGNNSNVHPDHHNLVAVIHDVDQKEWQIVNVNDGAAYSSNVSDDPGLAFNTWSFAGQSMNTTQFYGADKAPGLDRYVGGAQDNGSWFSPTGSANATTEWTEGWGGDGFDAVWHPTDINKLIVTSQNHGIARSINGGSSFSSSSPGDSSPPFIGQFANKIFRPDVVFCVGADGIYRSDDFAGSWQLVEDLSADASWGSGSLINIEISDASPDIVWAGSFINETRSLFLSTDGGENFQAVPYHDLNDGWMTGIATHPKDHKVVYQLFSYASDPKILRSEDLGQTWVDISGFSAASESTGFPDVAVYDLIVLPESNDIWVGTEIGIVESSDNGATWSLLDSSLPNVAVWDLEIKDDQIVIATHGRGVWSYTLDSAPEVLFSPEISSAQLLDEDFQFFVEPLSGFDSLEVYVADEKAISFTELSDSFSFSYITEETVVDLKLIAYKGSSPFSSNTVSVSNDVTDEEPEEPSLGVLSADFEVYPNPVNEGYFQIENAGLFVNEVRLLNIQGQVLKTWSMQEIDVYNVEDMKGGIYLVQVQAGDSFISKRLLIN